MKVLITVFSRPFKMKILIEVKNDLVKFFRNNVDNTEPIEVLLVNMLKLLREILTLTY